MSKSPFNWRLFFVLLGGATIGLVAILPYVLTLQGSAIAEASAAQAKMPLWALIAIQIASQVLVFGMAIWVGLSFAKSVGLGLPILEKWLSGHRVGTELRGILPLSVAVGVILALLLVGLEVFVFQPALLAADGAKCSCGVIGRQTRGLERFSGVLLWRN